MNDPFATFLWKIEPGLEQSWKTKEDERKKNELLNWNPSDFQEYAWWQFAKNIKLQVVCRVAILTSKHMPILKQKSQFKGLSVFMHKLIRSFDLAKGFQDDTDVSII